MIDSLLRAWQHDMGAAKDPSFPSCGQGVHNAEHLFSSRMIATDLMSEDLGLVPSW